MLFNKKLKKFLDGAVGENVIDGSVRENLLSHLEAKDKGTGLSLFTQAISIIGFFAVLLGIILIISHNWNDISKTTKIGSFLALLVLSHGAAFYITLKDLPYKKTALSLNFLGGGLVLAGIGLYAQIYNLTSTDGQAYLTWFVLIFPLAYLLKNRPLSLMALCAFLIWISIYTTYHTRFSTRDFIFLSVLISSTIIVYFSLISKDQWLRGFAKRLSYGVIAFVFVWLGFVHETSYSSFIKSWRGVDKTIMPVHYLFIAFTIFGLIYLIYKNIADGEDEKYFSAKEHFLLLLALLVCAYPYVFDNLAVMSFMSWVLWFVASLYLISLGSHKAHPSYVNWGVFFFAFGLFLRFIDLVSTMLKTGIAFIIFGVLLIIFSLAIEKWRKKILNNMTDEVKIID